MDAIVARSGPAKTRLRASSRALSTCSVRCVSNSCAAVCLFRPSGRSRWLPHSGLCLFTESRCLTKSVHERYTTFLPEKAVTLPVSPPLVPPMRASAAPAVLACTRNH